MADEDNLLKDLEVLLDDPGPVCEEMAQLQWFMRPSKKRIYHTNKPEKEAMELLILSSPYKYPHVLMGHEVAN